MRAALAGLVCAAMAALVQVSSATRHVRVEWVQVPPDRVRELCGNPHDPRSSMYASGCAKLDRNGCTIITPPMPIHQFTGFNHDMTDAVWRELSHEIMHCFGYEHAARSLR